MDKLGTGDRFPDMEARAVDDSSLSLPADLEGTRVVLLFYRGHW
ncbi:hypothetical protein BH23GEM9_BH23GEM9_14700 [soil metagenome]